MAGEDREDRGGTERWLLATQEPLQQCISETQTLDGKGKARNSC